MRRFVVIAVLLLLALPSCRSLPSIDKGVCGNGVVEPAAGEDCDLYAPPGSLCRAPGQPHACRFDCSVQPDGKHPTCPEGMGCGEDGICRRASGAFDVQKPTSVPAAPYDLGVADFDHDMRDDLLVTEGTRTVVHYFGDGAAPSQELDIPTSWSGEAPPPLPAIGELSGDGLPDVVVPFSTGVVVALGTADRSLVSTSYPVLSASPDVDQVYLIELNALPAPGDESLLIAHNKGASLSWLVHPRADAVDVLAPVLYPPSALAGDVATGNLDEDPLASPCDELVMPFSGRDRLYEYSPCKRSNNAIVLNRGGDYTQILLPGGDLVLGALTLIDLDHDGHLDVAVAVRNGADHYIDVAYGVGDGSFNSTLPVPAKQGDNTAVRAAGIGQAVPLAIGDLDGDGQPDYVDAKGVHVRRGSGFDNVAPSDPEGWSEAVITDLNRNGLPDVVAANANQSGAVFLDGAGGGLVTRFDVASDGPLSHLAIGDYDGDLLDDVAAIEDGGDSNPDRNRLVVMFGRSHGAPEPARREGLVDRALQVVASNTREYSPYAVSSLTVVSQAPDKELVFEGFGGRGDRNLRSPFVVTMNHGSGPDETITAYSPRRIAVGDFNGDGHGDLAEVTTTYPAPAGEYRLWLCPMTGQAESQLSDPRSSDPLPTDVEWDRSEIASGDLDGDGFDEVVLFAPDKSGAGSRAYVARSHDTGNGYAFVLGKAMPLSWRFEEYQPETVPGDPGGGRALVADVDADRHHYPDVLALAPASGKDPGALVVFHGNGTPALGKQDVIQGTPGGPIVAFSPIQADRDPALELALLAGSHVYIADLGSDGRYHVAESPVIELPGTFKAGLIAAGDFDGDGVDDIAVGNATTVEVFRGVPGNG